MNIIDNLNQILGIKEEKLTSIGKEPVRKGINYQIIPVQIDVGGERQIAFSVIPMGIFSREGWIKKIRGQMNTGLRPTTKEIAIERLIAHEAGLIKKWRRGRERGGRKYQIYVVSPPMDPELDSSEFMGSGLNDERYIVWPPFGEETDFNHVTNIRRMLDLARQGKLEITSDFDKATALANEYSKAAEREERKARHEKIKTDIDTKEKESPLTPGLPKSTLRRMKELRSMLQKTKENMGKVDKALGR